MEEDKLTLLFRDFDPELSPDAPFIDRLGRSLDAVELVKRQQLAERRRNKRAVLVAAVAGFVAGVVFAILLPFVATWLSAVHVSLPSFGLPDLIIDFRLVAWMAAASTAVLISVNAYEIALARMAATDSAAEE